MNSGIGIFGWSRFTSKVFIGNVERFPEFSGMNFIFQGWGGPPRGSFPAEWCKMFEGEWCCISFTMSIVGKSACVL